MLTSNELQSVDLNILGECYREEEIKESEDPPESSTAQFVSEHSSQRQLEQYLEAGVTE